MAARPPEPVGHLDFTHRTIDDVDKLRSTLQLAIEVEFTTIPPYLTALYSLTDTASSAYQALRNVVVEEMFHMNQVTDMLIGVGGKPRFTGSAVATYPTHLPSAKKTATPYVALFRATEAVFQNVFMAIEAPAPYYEDRDYRTIARLYDAIEQGLETCMKNTASQRSSSRRRGRASVPTSIPASLAAAPSRCMTPPAPNFTIQQIKQQDEGAVDLSAHPGAVRRSPLVWAYADIASIA